MYLLILSLATWRLANLLADEPGPLDVFERLRWLAGVRFNDVGEAYGSNSLARGLLCIKCNSVWLGAFWMVFYWWRSDYAYWAALPFALSGAAIIISELVEG